MKNTKYIITLISALFIGVSSYADHHGEKPGTIVEIALGNPSFTTLVEAVVKADLVDALNGKRQFTVFAPTNAAFDAAAEALIGAGATGSELVAALDVETLTNILLYHVAPGERYSPDVVSAQRIRTMAKDFLFVDVQQYHDQFLWFR